MDQTARTKAVPRWHLHRRLYDWVLHWADTPYGAPALGVLAFAESSFFPIPPDVLLIALVLGNRRKAWRLAAVCSVASVFGGLLGYVIGCALMQAVGWPIIRFYHAEQHFRQFEQWFREGAYLYVFLAAFTFIPYKVFTIASGVARIGLPGFLLASTIGRTARFFLVAGLIWWAGPRMKRWIDRYFNWVSLAFIVLLLGGFIIIKYLG